MRCNDCCKFVPYGDEPNTDELEVDCDEGTGNVSLAGRLILTCGECGGDLAAAELSADADADDVFGDEGGPDEEAGQTAEYTLQSHEFEEAGRTQETDRNGKPIKNSRYAKKFYGVKVVAHVKRIIIDNKGEMVGEAQEGEVVLEAEEQASSFEPA
jgi:hypothetical protein